MLSDTSLKIISEWKPVSEQTVGGGQKVSSKIKSWKNCGLPLPVQMKLTGTRCTLLSYRSKTLNKIHEKSFQILNRQHRIVIPKNYEVNFDCSSLLSEGSKPQHRKDLKLRWESSWEEHLKGEQRELQIFGRGLLHVFSWVLINRCIWNYPMLREEPPERNKQNNPWDSNG